MIVMKGFSMAEPKFISLKEFRALGLIQELNRQFLHPRGLALSVKVDSDLGEEVFDGIWDCREDPEGLCYGDGVLLAEKAKESARLFEEKKENRLASLGWIIQPVPEKE
jgi:hypothetical protein